MASKPVDEGVFEDFAAVEEWEALDGSFAVVEDGCPEGTGSTCLEIERGERRSRIARQFDPPIDVSGVRVTAALRSVDSAYPRVQLLDEDGDQIRFRAPVRGGLATQRFNFGVEAVEGEPDLTRIVTVRFMQSQSRRMWIDHVGFHGTHPGTVAITFDDGEATDHTVGLPILREYDLPATTFVNTARVGKPGKLDLEQLAELRDAGWDVCNHTADHANLGGLGEGGQRTQIRSARQWLLDHGFERGARYFAYPYSRYEQTTLDIVEDEHRMAFAGGYPATGYVPNTYLVPRIDVADVETARRGIDLAGAYGGVTCLLYHKLDGAEVRQFERVAEYLHRRASAGDVDVATASDLDRLLLGRG